MKLLLVLITLTAGAIGKIADTLPSNHELLMQITHEKALESRVKIYTYDGNLLREFPLTDVMEDNITVIDHLILKESDFAFDHSGDYYYFRESDSL